MPEITPLRFDSSAQHLRFNEGRTHSELAATMRHIQETTFADYGHAQRSVHAKSHGILEGELRVLDGLPKIFAQGLFGKRGSYPVILRFSTNPGDILDDSISVPRGLAIKVMGVEGRRLPGSEGDTTQDFVMVNGPAFAVRDAESFVGTLQTLAKTTDTGQAWKKVLSTALRGAVATLHAAKIDGGALKAIGGHPMTHPLGETYFAQTPFRYGDYVAKFSVAPVSPQLQALKDAPVDLRGKPNGLREAIIAYFRQNSAEWELRVQLRTRVDMPIDDATAEWSQEDSPFTAVARITVSAQPAWNEARAQQVDDRLSFSPWHGLAAHQPLGSVNRARKMAYAKGAQFRGARNGCPIHEPHRAQPLSRQPAQLYGTTPGREGRRANTPDAPARNVTKVTNDGGTLHAAAGAISGLLAGVAVSAFLLRPEATSGRASELVELQRKVARKMGYPARSLSARPTVAEEVSAHGGHLALSAIAGAGYGLATRNRASPLVAGLMFGAGFYALAYGVVGPALGVTPKLRASKPSDLVQHGALHALFGVLTAVGTNAIAKRL